MSIEWLSVCIIVGLIGLLVLGLPLAWAIGAVAVTVTLTMFDPAVMVMLVSRVFDMSLNYTLMAVPLFVLMAAILQRAGIAEQLFKAVNIWAGGVRGGLAFGTIVANAIMASIVGIIGAEIVTFGLIALPEMLKRKYDDQLALGSIAAGGGLATLIPPSVVFIVYAMTAGCSVGELFLAGVLPGFLLGVLFVGYVFFRVWRHPESAPPVSAEERDIPLRAKLAMLKELVAPLVLAAGVLGSMYAGIATPSEAAGVGVIGAMIAAAINRRLSWANLRESLFDTVKISCMLTWLFFGAQAIIGAYTLAGGNTFVKNTLAGTDLGMGPWGTIILMQLIWVFLGCFLDWVGILFLTVPLFLPVVNEMGFSPIWFGVVYCMNMHISYLTPPFGPSCFYLTSVTPKGITSTQVYKAILPYMWLTFLATAITAAFPGLSLWLPRLMGH
jgi:tripartite ATP-independent transporter DctM subunit